MLKWILSTTLTLLISAGIQAGTIQGTVTDAETGEPIGGAVVIATSGFGGRATIDSATTNAEGAYSITDLVQGIYLTAASAEGYQPSQSNFPVDLGRNQTVEWDFELSPGSGTGSASIGGTVTDRETNEPVEGAQVILSVMTGFGGGGSRQTLDTVMTDAEGGYTFADLIAAQRYRLDVTADGYFAGRQSNIILQPGQDFTADISLEPVGDQVGAIAGTITDSESNEPINGATVILSMFLGGGEYRMLDTILTGADGQYSFTEVPAGNGYRVQASADNHESATQRNIEVTTGETTAANLALTPVVPPSGVVTGLITDTESNPLSDATVILQSITFSGGSIGLTNIDTVASGEDGTYEFNELESGRYRIRASLEGYEDETSDDSILENEDTLTIDLSLTEISMGTMTVLVLAESDDSPIEGATVTATLKATDGETYTATSGGDGYASLGEVISGDYTVTVSKTGYDTETQQRRVSPEENDSATVLLAEATGMQRVLVGTITNKDEEPVSGASVELRAGSDDDILTLTAESDAEGKYEISGILMDYSQVRVTITATGYVENSAQVQLTGDTVTYDVRLEADPASPVVTKVSAVPGIRLESNSSGRFVRFVNMKTATTLNLYTINGRLAFSREVPRGTHLVNLPKTVAEQKTLLVVETATDVLLTEMLSR